MAPRVQDRKPRRSAIAQAWLRENIIEQQARYREIVKEMDALEPTRRKWYQAFFEIIQTRGTNVTGDTRRKISKAELPRKPNRNDQVVY